MKSAKKSLVLSHSEQLSRVAMMFIITLFLVNFASAFDFDNRITDISEDKIEMTIYNSFLGIPTTEIGRLKLNTPMVNYVKPGKDKLVGEFTIDLTTDEYKEFIKDMKTISGKTNKKINREVVVRKKIIDYEEVPFHSTICEDDGSIAKNCYSIENGTYQREVISWVDFEPKDLKKGSTTIGVFSNVYVGDEIDWIPEIFGVEIPWAWWIGITPTHYWKLNETSTANAVDSSGNGKTLTNSGGTFVTGKLGNAFNCSGDKTLTNTTTGTSFEFGTGNFSIAIWVKMGTISSYQALITTDTGWHNYDDWSIITETNGRLRLQCGSTEISTTTEVDDNNWHRVVFVREGTGANQVKIYIDGSTTPDVSATCNVDLNNERTFIIGDNVALSNYLHLIDDVQIFKGYAWTTADVTEDWNSGTGKEGDTITTHTMQIINSYPANAAKYNSLGTITFECNATSTNQNISSITLNVTGTETWTQTATGLSGTSVNQTFTNSTITDGTYNWNCIAYGDEGINDTSNIWTFTIDTINPQVQVVYPTTSDYNINVSALNYTYSDNNPDSCWYSKGAGATNSTKVVAGTNFTGVISSEGSNTWIVYCNDTFGHLNSSSVTFFKDTIYPLIDWVDDFENLNPQGNVTSRSISTKTNIVELNWVNGTLNVYNSTGSLYGSSTTSLPSTPFSGYFWEDYSVTEDGAYTYNVTTCDRVNNCNTTSTRSVLIDTIAPTISIATPTGNLGLKSIPYNISLNYSVSDTHLSNCWYNSTWNATTTALASCANATILVSDTSYTQTIYVYVNDTHGNENMSSTSWSIYQLNSVTYNTTSYVNQQERFTLNITGLTITSATLYYNGTGYTSTINGGIVTNSLVVPSGTGAKTFFWALNSGAVNTTTYTQTISATPTASVSATCSAGLSPAVTLTFFNETNVGNNNATFTYNIQYGLSTPNLTTINGTITNVHSASICINASQPNLTLGYGEITYTSTGYTDRRYYLYNGTILDATLNSYNLYSLENSLATSVLVTAQNRLLTAYVNYYVGLLRWYPTEDTYRVVEMGKTDDNGQTILRVKTEDVDYRMAVYDINGNLQEMINPLRIICLTTPCTYNLYIDEAGDNYLDYFGVEQNLSYNNETGYFTFIWNDASGTTDTMSLYVYKEGALSRIDVCSDTGSGSTGVISCNASGYTGVIKAVAYRTASPSTIIASLIKQISNDNFLSTANGKTIGLLFSFLVVLLLALVGVFSPIGALVLAVVGLIPALFLGAINLMVAIGVGILAFVVFHAIKRS